MLRALFNIAGVAVGGVALALLANAAENGGAQSQERRRCIICHTDIRDSDNKVQCRRGHWHHEECRDNLKQDGQEVCSECQAEFDF